MDMKPTIKRSIKPVTFTVTVVAHKVNENGTFSSFEIKDVKGIKNSTLKVVAPPKGGGSLFIRVATLEGVEVLKDKDNDDGTTTEKVKLF